MQEVDVCDLIATAWDMAKDGDVGVMGWGM